MKDIFKCTLIYTKNGDEIDEEILIPEDNLAKANINLDVMNMEIDGADKPNEHLSKKIFSINQDIPLPDYFSSECYAMIKNTENKILHVGEKRSFKLLLFRNKLNQNMLKVKVDERNLNGKLSWR